MDASHKIQTELVQVNVSEDEMIADISRRQAPPVALASRLTMSIRKPAPPADSPDLVSARAKRLAEHDEYQRRMEIKSVMENLWKQAGDRFRRCTASAYVVKGEYQRRVAEAVLNYAANIAENYLDGTGLVLYGPVGTGKDHLAFVVATAAVRASLSVTWLRGQEWFGEIRDAIDSDRSEASMMEKLTKPKILCLSDPLPPIGNLTQHQATMLYRLVESRYSLNLPTVVTVNVANDDEADNRLGAPTWDRLCHGAMKVLCAWESFRRPKLEIRP